MKNLPLATKALSITLAVLLVVTPLFAQQEMNEFLVGKRDGQQDAEGNRLWFLAGFLGVVGLLLAYVVEPDVPTGHLIGKSPQYVQGYIEGYQKKARNKNMTYAAYGWITETVLLCSCYAFLFAGILTGSAVE
jgi:hypothetical protein